MFCAKSKRGRSCLRISNAEAHLKSLLLSNASNKAPKKRPKRKSGFGESCPASKWVVVESAPVAV